MGKGATALVAFMFGLTAATPMTILGFALLTAVISSLIDDALVGKINDYVINL
ncbi:Colicin pore forming domain protein [compost metagenome]